MKNILTIFLFFIVAYNAKAQLHFSYSQYNELDGLEINSLKTEFIKLKLLKNEDTLNIVNVVWAQNFSEHMVHIKNGSKILFPDKTILPDDVMKKLERLKILDKHNVFLIKTEDGHTKVYGPLLLENCIELSELKCTMDGNLDYIFDNVPFTALSKTGTDIKIVTAFGIATKFVFTSNGLMLYNPYTRSLLTVTEGIKCCKQELFSPKNKNRLKY